MAKQEGRQAPEERTRALVRQIADDLGRDFDEMWKALFEPRRDWRPLKRNLIIFMLGLILVAGSVWLDSAAQGPHLNSAKLFEHVGVALIVAVLVAELFHHSHERKLITEPLTRIGLSLREVSAGAAALGDEIRNRTDQLAVEVSGFNNILRFTKDRGIIGAFTPKSDEWRTAITQVVNEADEYLFISARTLRSYLRGDHAEEGSGWLGKAIEERLARKPDVETAFLLSDVFDKNGAYREELKLIFRDRPENQAERLACRESVLWILRLMQAAQTSGNGPQISLRLLQSSPWVFMVMSEKSAIVGHYLPFKPLNSVRMIRVKGGMTLHDEFKDYFETFFALGMDPSQSVGKYLARHRHDDGGEPELLSLRTVRDATPAMAKVAHAKRELFDRRNYFFGGPVNPALVRTYRRGDARFIEAVQEAVRSENQALHIIGRTHSSMLGSGDGVAGAPRIPWLRATLLEALSREGRAPRLTVILPDTFTSDATEYGEEVQAIVRAQERAPLAQRAASSSVSEIRELTRKTVCELIRLQIDANAPEEALRVVLVRQSPRVCMLMTSRTCFTEMYVPGLDGGLEEIREIQHLDSQGHESTSFAAFREYFESMRVARDARSAVDVIREYCRTYQGSDNDSIRDKRALLAAYEEKYKVKA